MFLWVHVQWPRGSMYGIFIYIYHKNQPNVGKYTIHGWYGWCYLKNSNSQNRILHSVKEKPRKNVSFLFSPLKIHKVSVSSFITLSNSTHKKVQNVVGLSWSYAYNMHVNRYIVYVKYMYIIFLYYISEYSWETQHLKKNTENDSMLGSAIF